METKNNTPKNHSEKPSQKGGRRSGADRRTKFITPYMDFVYNGDEKRSDDDRRKSNDRRKNPRDKS